MTKDKPLEERSVTFGVRTVLAALGVVIACTYAVSVQLTTVNRKIDDLAANSYTIDKASEVALRQAIADPGHPVVDPREPSRLITVRGVDRTDTIDGKERR